MNVRELAEKLLKLDKHKIELNGVVLDFSEYNVLAKAVLILDDALKFYEDESHVHDWGKRAKEAREEAGTAND